MKSIKKLTVSVGIPALNEDANIKQLLEALLSQRGKNYQLKEIIVVSDNSTDNTNDIVRSFAKNKVKLIINNKRLGQGPSQEKIIKDFAGDILVLLNADVMPSGSNFIDLLVEPFLKSKNIALVSPRIVPVKANTLFEKIINYSYDCRESMLSEWNNGNNILHCFGAGRAFSREFAKKIKWPSSVGEDAYTYFLCITNNYQFKYQPRAELLYKSPDNISDYQKQSSRFINSQVLMSDIFGKELVEKTYQIPLNLKAKSTILFFFKNPFYWITYACTFLLIYILPGRKKYSNSLWETSKSSKVLTAK